MIQGSSLGRFGVDRIYRLGRTRVHVVCVDHLCDDGVFGSEAYLILVLLFFIFVANSAGRCGSAPDGDRHSARDEPRGSSDG